MFGSCLFGTTESDNIRRPYLFRKVSYWGMIQDTVRPKYGYFIGRRLLR